MYSSKSMVLCGWLVDDFWIMNFGDINEVLLYFQTPNGNVEAKVMCFFRRRDLPNTLIMLADKHQSEYSYTLLYPNAICTLMSECNTCFYVRMQYILLCLKAVHTFMSECSTCFYVWMQYMLLCLIAVHTCMSECSTYFYVRKQYILLCLNAVHTFMSECNTQYQFKNINNL